MEFPRRPATVKHHYAIVRQTMDYILYHKFCIVFLLDDRSQMQTILYQCPASSKFAHCCTAPSLLMALHLQSHKQPSHSQPEADAHA
jgi:hypothetical protein